MEEVCINVESLGLSHEKLLKEELLTGFSPRVGFFPGSWTTSIVLDLCAFTLIFLDELIRIKIRII